MIVLALLVASIPEGLVLSVVLANANFFSSLTHSKIHIRNIQTSQSLPKITHHIISCKQLDQNLISSLNAFTEQISVIIVVEERPPSDLLDQSDLQEIKTIDDDIIGGKRYLMVLQSNSNDLEHPRLIDKKDIIKEVISHLKKRGEDQGSSPVISCFSEKIEDETGLKKADITITSDLSAKVLKDS
jgi:hypothetical protein